MANARNGLRTHTADSLSKRQPRGLFDDPSPWGSGTALGFNAAMKDGEDDDRDEEKGDEFEDEDDTDEFDECDDLDEDLDDDEFDDDELDEDEDLGDDEF